MTQNGFHVGGTECSLRSTGGEELTDVLCYELSIDTAVGASMATGPKCLLKVRLREVASLSMPKQIKT